MEKVPLKKPLDLLASYELPDLPDPDDPTELNDPTDYFDPLDFLAPEDSFDPDDEWLTRSQKKEKRRSHSKTVGYPNRIRALMEMGKRYAFRGTQRMAEDLGRHPATLRRIFGGSSRPSSDMRRRICRLLSRDLGLAGELPVSEVFLLGESYPTPNAGDLCKFSKAPYKSNKVPKTGVRARLEARSCTGHATIS